MLGSSSDASVANSHFAAFVRKGYRSGFNADLSVKISSWLKRMRGDSIVKKGHNFEVTFQDTPDQVLENSPVKELVASYYEVLLKVRDEIVERQKHQSQMLRI